MTDLEITFMVEVLFVLTRRKGIFGVNVDVKTLSMPVQQRKINTGDMMIERLCKLYCDK